MSKPRSATNPESAVASILQRRHIVAGWWALLIFLSLGLLLEALHGFKVASYLGMSNETRRLMWTLAHAHGTLLGLINLALAYSVGALPSWSPGARAVASASLLGATLLMPAGFFLGGVNPVAGDPGLGIVLLPVGGLLLFVAVLCVALASVREKST